TLLMITDMTTGTGRFNLVQGFIGTIIAIAAAISTGTTGFIFERLGHVSGFLILAAAAAAATILFWVRLTQTKQDKHLDLNRATLAAPVERTVSAAAQIA